MVVMDLPNLHRSSVFLVNEQRKHLFEKELGGQQPIINISTSTFSFAPWTSTSESDGALRTPQTILATRAAIDPTLQVRPTTEGDVVALTSLPSFSSVVSSCTSPYWMLKSVHRMTVDRYGDQTDNRSDYPAVE